MEFREALRPFTEIQPPYDHDNLCSFCMTPEGQEHPATCSWVVARALFADAQATLEQRAKEFDQRRGPFLDQGELAAAFTRSILEEVRKGGYLQHAPKCSNRKYRMGGYDRCSCGLAELLEGLK